MTKLLLYSSLLFFTLLIPNNINAQQLNVKLFVASDNAGNGPSAALINGTTPGTGIIAEVTEMYNQQGIELNICPVFVTNQSWVNNPRNFKFDNCIDDLGYLALLVINNQGAGAGAVCQNTNNGNTSTRGWAIATTYTVAHELAHMLSLQHTFLRSYCVGDSGDGIADTPFVPADLDNSSHDDFLASVNPQNWTGCAVNWSMITDDCGNSFNYSAVVDEAIRTNVMGEFTDVPNGCSWDFNLTFEQALQINNAITNHLHQYTSPSGDCNNLPNVKILSGAINGTIENNTGFVYIEDNVQVNGTLTLNNSIVFASPGASLIVNNGGTLNSFSTNYSNDDCSNELWGGIEAKSGSNLNFNRVNIENAITGLQLYTKDVSIDYVVISDCTNGFDALLNNGLSHVNLDNMRFINSPVTVSNSALKFRGSKFSSSDVNINECNIFFEPVAAGIEYNRPYFFRSNINYNSGTFLGVTYGRFDNANTFINNCNYAFLCGSLYEDPAPTNNTVFINNTGKHDIVQNIFNNGSTAVEVQTGVSSSLSHYKNNIHNNIATNLHSISDNLIETSCNFHASHVFAYQTVTGLIDQGDSDNIPNNIFETPALSFDIQAEFGSQNFNYYYNPSNTETLPSVNNSSLVTVIDVFGQSDGCLSKDVLLEPWEGVKLCEPETWNEFCDDTGCGYYRPPPIEYPESARYHNDEVTEAQSFDSPQLTYSSNDNQLEIRWSDNESKNRPSYDVKVYSSSGVLVATSKFDNSDSMLLPYTLPEGLYFSVVLDEYGNVLTTNKFFKK